MAYFRNNIIRAFLCPECLGEGKFHQIMNSTEWKDHLISHLSMKAPAPWSCGHPRCTRVGAMSQWDVYLCHLGDIHDVRFSASQRERLYRSLLPSRPKLKRQAAQCSANRSTKIKSGMKRGTTVFVTYTAGSLKRRLQNRERRKRARRQSLPDIENLRLST